MEYRLQNLLLSCRRLDFGTVHLSEGEKNFYKKFNNTIISLCKSLPESAQTDALLFVMRYSGLSIGGKLDFFKNYYVPSWSLIYWILQYAPGSKVLSHADIQNAISGHSMAMFLHSLDDHINDGEVPASHTTLLLRSQSWLRMVDALKGLSEGCEAGEKTIERFINEYYSGILNSDDIATLDDYCELFRKQMATWMIAPLLMIQKIATDKEVSSALESAYGSFGVAWRLLDDIMDVEADMKNSARSALYVCLPENLRIYWNNHDSTGLNNENNRSEILLDYVHDNNIVDKIKGRICSELESAASIAECIQMIGLAEEFRELLRPIKSAQ